MSDVEGNQWACNLLLKKVGEIGSCHHSVLLDTMDTHPTILSPPNERMVNHEGKILEF
jgi:hypothetical protein